MVLASIRIHVKLINRGRVESFSQLINESRLIPKIVAMRQQLNIKIFIIFNHTSPIATL